MKTRPILFQPEMARANWDGLKTRSRRIMKPQPDGCVAFSQPVLHDGVAIFRNPHSILRQDIRCPYGAPGSLLWVREPHYVERAGYKDGSDQFILYRATDPDAPVGAWTPAIHMPRWASRMTLELTEVRVERLQDISEEEAEREGVAQAFETPSGAVQSYPRYTWGFCKLWRSINGPRSWDANPWVWVLAYIVHRQNVDALLGGQILER